MEVQEADEERVKAGLSLARSSIETRMSYGAY